MMKREIADAFDELAGDFKRQAREVTVGATESVIAGSLARIFTTRAARLRSAADDADDAAERRRAEEAERAKRPPLYDPAEHTVNEVNDHLATVSEEEKVRVLGLEAQDRPEVPEGKKQRTGILSGPHGQF